MLQPGAPAPDLTLQDAHGAATPLSAWHGKRLVLYFYPKDGTPPCTVEACAFRDNLDALRARGAEVVGVSPDAPGSHAAFARKHGLGFPLLSDADLRLAEAFGAVEEQIWAGKTFRRAARMTFLIDEEGIVRRAWDQVDPRHHVREVVAALDAMEEAREPQPGEPQAGEPQPGEPQAGELRARAQEARQLTDRPIASPFAAARLAEGRLSEIRRREDHESGPVDREQVLAVLATLRPYMQADGGDVELVAIEDGAVKVRLQGACGTCPSASVTLRMGLEAQLKQRVAGITSVEAVF